MAGKNDEVNELAKIAVVGVIGYFAVNAILKKLGIIDDDTDNLVNAQASIPDSDNPFSLNWGAYDKNLGPGIAKYNIDFITKNAGNTFLDYSTSNNLDMYWVPLADDIYHSMGYLEIDQDAVLNDFAQVKTQADVWQMAVYIQAKYDANLWDWLKHGQSWTPWDNGLSHEALAQIINRVNSLPLGI